jgi:hypothetical protein
MLKRGSKKAQSTKIGLKDPLPKQQLHSANCLKQSDCDYKNLVTA